MKEYGIAIGDKVVLRNPCEEDDDGGYGVVAKMHWSSASNDIAMLVDWSCGSQSWILFGQCEVLRG